MNRLEPESCFAFAAAFFDFDGTIVDSEPASSVAFRDVIGELGTLITEAESEVFCYGRSWHSIFNTVSELHPELKGRYHKFASMIEELINREGGYLGTPIEPSLSTLKQVAKHVPIGIVSGSFRSNLSRALNTLGLSQYVATIVGAEDYTQGKPNPEPYLIAAQELRIEPDACVVFEDSQLGIESAQAAGMKCVALNGRFDAATPHLAVDSLDDVRVWDFLHTPLRGPHFRISTNGMQKPDVNRSKL